MRFRRTIAVLFALAASLPAQSGFHRPAEIPDTSSAALRFERNINTYLWNAGARSVIRTDNLFVRLSEQFNSNYISTASRSYRDDQTLSLGIEQNIGGPFAAAVEVQSFVLSDNQTLGSSTAGVQTGLAGLSYRPIASVTITPLAGIRVDRQQKEQDNGLAYRLYGDADSIDLGGYRASFSGHLNESDMGRRAFRSNGAEVTIAGDLSHSAQDSLRVRWSDARNDFFIAAADTVRSVYGVSSNIRSRSESQYGVRNELHYDIGGGFRAELEAGVDARTIRNAVRYNVLSAPKSVTFNTGVREFRLDGDVRLTYLTDGLFAAIGLTVGERDERHQMERFSGVDQDYQESSARLEARLDNTAFRNMLSLSVNADLSDDDQLIVNSSAGLLRYDTPSNDNTDDRDELLINTTIKEIHRFSRVFTGTLTAEMTNAHLVYIFSDKSANNSWNHVLRLSPELTYRPSSSFRMTNAFEVLANYTVFDFEQVVAGVHSYSYRQVAFLDSTSYDISPRVGAELFAFVRIFERGELRWTEFSERPLQRIEEVTFSPQMRYSGEGRWSVAAGFRSFAQKRFSYVNNQRRFDNTYLSAGPTAAVSIRLSSASLVEVRGWKEFQHQSGAGIREYSNITMNVRYIF